MIKEVLDSLSPEQKRQLMYAFEHQFSQYIELPGKKFIGVNVKPIKHLAITESAGDWSTGEVKGEGNAEGDKV